MTSFSRLKVKFHTKKDSGDIFSTTMSSDIIQKVIGKAQPKYDQWTPDFFVDFPNYCKRQGSVFFKLKNFLESL